MPLTTRALVIGDMHVTPEELDDCNRVIELAIDVCYKENLKEVWFTGDQHHTHSILRLEVLHWWKTAFKALYNAGLKAVLLVGNHDQSAPGSHINAMMAYEGTQGVKIIDRPQMHGGVLMVPYIHEQADFTKAVKDYLQGGAVADFDIPPPRTILCHQTFDGSTYENGFLASDGFDPNLLPVELVISGHIHTGQEFGKVWYVGAPRWRSLSDANTDRAVWVLEFENGRLQNRKPYSTGEVCRQIRHVDDTPDNPVPLPLDLRHQWRIDIKGPADWCQARKKELHAAGARVRTFPTQTSLKGRVRESEGIDKAFRTFVGAYQSKHGTARETLEVMAKERLSV